MSRFLSFLSLLILAAPVFPADTIELDRSTSELRPMIERYTADRRSLTRTYPIRLSATRRARFERFAMENEAELRKVNFDTLSHDAQIDYLLFRNHLEHDRSELELDSTQMTEMEPLPVGEPVFTT